MGRCILLLQQHSSAYGTDSPEYAASMCLYRQVLLKKLANEDALADGTFG
jgi:hypothetical protein